MEVMRVERRLRFDGEKATVVVIFGEEEDEGAVCGGDGDGLVVVGLDLGAKKREIICCFCLPMVVEVVVEEEEEEVKGFFR